MTFITRGSSLFGLLFILNCGVSFADVQDDDPSEAPGEVASTYSGSDQTRKPASEADFREEVQRVEQLARGLEGRLKAYHEHLQTAMLKRGYGPYPCVAVLQVYSWRWPVWCDLRIPSSSLTALIVYGTISGRMRQL
jgi:hypothetical protein